jgi:hypothetical protein
MFKRFITRAFLTFLTGGVIMLIGIATNPQLIAPWGLVVWIAGGIWTIAGLFN